jgi:hypothetical protein
LEFSYKKAAPLYPVVSVQNMRATVNFGQYEFSHPEPQQKGYLPLTVSPINTQLLHEINPKIGESIMFREWFAVEEQHRDNLVTHAFLSHKRTSAQGVAGFQFSS